MPNTTLDKWMWRTAYLYLAIPFIIFCIGWLRWLYSIPVSFCVIIAIYMAIRQHKQFLPVNFKKYRRIVWICFALLVAWVFFSGIGQFSYQNGDHYARNAVLKDLVERPWPLVYDFSAWQPYGVTQPGNYMLIYYLGYWLPAALVGKVFGLATAHVFLFLWTVLGVTLVFYFICRFLRKISWWIVLLFMLFGGMDMIPFLVKGTYDPFLHLEWWRNGFQQYTSNTSLLYWVFNQVIAPWLIIGMLFNAVPKKSMALLCALCFFYAPFPFVGLLPFAIYFFSRESGRALLNNLLSFQSIVSGLVMLIMAGYYTSVSATASFNLYIRSFTSNLAFYIIEFLLVALVIFLSAKRRMLVTMVVVILVILSFIQYRQTPDLMMRASVPALFVLMLLAAEQLLNCRRRALNYILVVLLLIGSVTSLNEINRSLYYTGKYTYVKYIRGEQPAFPLLQQPALFEGKNPVIVTMIGDTNALFCRIFCREH